MSSKFDEIQKLPIGVWHRDGSLLFKLKENPTPKRDSSDGKMVLIDKMNDVTMLVQVQPYDEKRAEQEAKDLHLMLQTNATMSLTQPEVREKLAAFLNKVVVEMAQNGHFDRRSEEDTEAVLKNLLWRFVMNVHRKPNCKVHRPSSGQGDCEPCSDECRLATDAALHEAIVDGDVDEVERIVGEAMDS